MAIGVAAGALKAQTDIGLAIAPYELKGRIMPVTMTSAADANITVCI
jgi:hypothetical protein